jgi:hypothetical protein
MDVVEEIGDWALIIAVKVKESDIGKNSRS